MERESFEDEAVARILNAEFVPVKVDREERPDLDELYMAAVQAITGQGGWPMSVWLTPDLKPFYGGTYFPPAPATACPPSPRSWRGSAGPGGSGGGTWKATPRPWLKPWPARRIRRSRGRPPRTGPAPGRPSGPGTPAPQLRRRLGGLGPPPKFPQPMVLDLILRHGSPADRAMAVRTLDAMADGGIYDHLGGGFSRYSVDRRWLVPHFEKMLYDNAQLAACYLDAHQAIGKEAYRTVARETLDYLLRDLRDPAGGFHSSEDADSEGQEGRFYVFTPAEVRGVLGDGPGYRFCQAYGIADPGPFEHGASVLHRFDAPPGPDPESLDRARAGLMDQARAALRAHRDTRVRPGKDDKVLAAWNGLALTALARGFQVLGDPRYLEAATGLAVFLRREMAPAGALARSWRRGQVGGPGFLEDYAAVAAGLVDLYEAGFDPSWLRWADQLAGAMLSRFGDPGTGGCFGSPAPGDGLLFRQKPFVDGAMPSGNSLAARALLRLYGHLERPEHRAGAEGILAARPPCWSGRPPPSRAS